MQQKTTKFVYPVSQLVSIVQRMDVPLGDTPNPDVLLAFTPIREWKVGHKMIIEGSTYSVVASYPNLVVVDNV